MHTYSIAGFILGLNGYIDEFTALRMQPYECTTDKADAVVNCSLCDIPFQCHNAESTYGSGDEYWEHTDGHTYAYLFPDGNGCFAVKLDYYNNGGNADIYLYDLAKHMQADTTHYLFNALSFMFNHLVVYHGMMVLHSSSLACNGAGIAFSADSGVGKSTHTGLWMEHIPGCTYINDDTPLLYIQDGTVYISGTPFAGSSGINTNIAVPLKAIVFIRRGADNSIEKIDTQTAFALMMRQCIEPAERCVMDKMLDIVSDVLSSVSVYQLYCNISDKAAHTAYDGIFAE